MPKVTRITDAKKPRAQRLELSPSGEARREYWDLRLYVAGQTAKSVFAFANLKRLCEDYLDHKYRIEVVDLLLQPHLAREDQIVALPTLVRKLPPPILKIIGDLSNRERVLLALGILEETD